MSKSKKDTLESKNMSLVSTTSHIRDITTKLTILTDDRAKFCKIMSWNVAGLRGLLNKSSQLLQTVVANHHPDILCIQETKLQTSQGMEELLPDYKSYWICSEKKKGYSGVAIFLKKSSIQCNDEVISSGKSSKQATLLTTWTKKANTGSIETKNLLELKHIEYELSDSRFQGEGRLIAMDLNLFYLIGCYVPNSGQSLERLDYRVDEWEPYMRDYLSELKKKKPVIFTGDLNVGHLDLDIHNPTANHIVKQAGLTPREREAMTQLLSCGFVDAFRFLYPNSRGNFSYWSQRTMARPVNKGIRLDYFICSDDLFGSVSPETIGNKRKLNESKDEFDNDLPLVLEPRSQVNPPLPYVFDSYILHEDTIGCSDHCPVMLVLKLQ